MTFQGFFILALLWSVSSPATTVVPMRGETPVPMKDEGTVGWFAATDEEVKNAPCKTTHPPSMDEIEKYLNEASSGKKVSGKINGISFIDEERSLRLAFRDLTSSESVLRLQKLYSINPTCTRILCAVEAIWGKELGYKILYLKLKYGFNAAEYRYGNSSRFQIEELNDVLMAVADLPSIYVPFSEEQQLTRFTVGLTLKEYEDASGSVAANASIELFDAWSRGSSFTRQYEVFHELGHNISEKNNTLDETISWKKLTKADAKGEHPCKVSRYSEVSLGEMFAESVSAYRYNGSSFKERCPVRYEYLKEHVFGGREYDSEENCRKP